MLWLMREIAGGSEAPPSNFKPTRRTRCGTSLDPESAEDRAGNLKGITMAKIKANEKKAKGAAGTDKNTTLLKMLKAGATVEALTKSLGWLPHTLRARISCLAKPKSKGGQGLKIERTRVEKITSYKIA
jgi:hypothetical protein